MTPRTNDPTSGATPDPPCGLIPDEARMVMNYLDALPGTDTDALLRAAAENRGDAATDLEAALVKVVRACRASYEASLPNLTPNEVLDLLGVETLPLTYAGFLAYVLRALVDPGAVEWRVGQTFFNVLDAHRPDLAAWLRASDADPFHHDERLPYVLRLVEARWEES